MRPALGELREKGQKGNKRTVSPAGLAFIRTWTVGPLELFGGHCQGRNYVLKAVSFLEELTCLKDHHIRKDLGIKTAFVLFFQPPSLAGD